MKGTFFVLIFPIFLSCQSINNIQDENEIINELKLYLNTKVPEEAILDGINKYLLKPVFYKDFNYIIYFHTENEIIKIVGIKYIFDDDDNLLILKQDKFDKLFNNLTENSKPDINRLLNENIAVMKWEYNDNKYWMSLPEINYDSLEWSFFIEIE